MPIRIILARLFPDTLDGGSVSAFPVQDVSLGRDRVAQEFAFQTVTFGLQHLWNHSRIERP